jgi:hypothetical protein
LSEKYGAVSDTKVATQTKNNPQYGLVRGAPTGRGPNGEPAGGWHYVQTGNTVTTINNYTKIFNKYSPKIEVELYYGDTWPTRVCYTWKEFRDKLVGSEVEVEL